jgi:hypothetical protein
MKSWKRSIKIAGLWLTLSNVHVKKRNSRKVGDSDNIDSTYRMKDIRKEVKAAQGNRCPMCGEVSERMELHHILPVARFPELWDDRRNCVALCHDCHKEIHCNPWANMRMMQGKAAELGLELGEGYDTTQKLLKAFQYVNQQVRRCIEK